MNHINLKFILITENYSFIPDNIINRSKTIKLAIPCKSVYKKSFKYELKSNQKVSDIINLKNIEKNGFRLKSNKINLDFNKYDKLRNKLLKQVIEIKNIDFLEFREIIYDLLIYDLSVDAILYLIISDLINLKLDEKKISNYCFIYMIFLSYIIIITDQLPFRENITIYISIN